jgi:hypothetical protein
VTGERTGVTPSPVVASLPQTYQQYFAPAAPPAAAFNPRIVFTNSRGGSTLYPGDTWKIQVSGAYPNSAISVVGGKNGAQDVVQMGTADASGNFALSGTANSSELGTWNETWRSGAHTIGSISFSIAAGPGGTVGGGSGGGAGSGSGGSGGSGGGGGTMSPDSSFTKWFTEEMISGIPNWILVAGGLVGGVVLAGGKR